MCIVECRDDLFQPLDYRLHSDERIKCELYSENRDEKH